MAVKSKTEPGRQGELILGGNLLDDPFDPIEVALARERIRAELDAQLDENWHENARERTVYIARDEIIMTLGAIERHRPGGGRRIMRTGVDPELLDWYLSAEGLTYLQTQETGDAASEMKTLVERMIVMRESAARWDVKSFKVGAPGGLTAGLIHDLVRRQIRRRSEEMAGELHARYLAEYPKVKQMLQRIFPDFASQISGRAKDPASIADKLERKALRMGASTVVIRDIEDAAAIIGDGHGLSLVLDNVSHENLSRVRDQLIRAVRAGEIQVIEINNFRGDGKDALPYLTETDVERIRMAAEARRMTLHPADRPAPVRIVDGPAHLKPVGYTTTKMNLRLRNPETGRNDLPVCEFQIRGREVNHFSDIEHLVYDIRQGKNLFKNEAIRRRFASEVTPLLAVIQEMSAEQFWEFTEYLSRFYLFSRRLEQGQVVPEPEKPLSLPEICHVRMLKRLSHMHRELVREHYQPSKV